MGALPRSRILRLREPPAGELRLPLDQLGVLSLSNEEAAATCGRDACATPNAANCRCFRRTTLLSLGPIWMRSPPMRSVSERELSLP